MVNGELGCGHQQSACRSSFTTIHCAQGCGSRAMPVAHFPPPRRPLPPPTAGLVDTPTTFTMDDLLAMPSIDVTCTLTCAGACRCWGCVWVGGGGLSCCCCCAPPLPPPACMHYRTAQLTWPPPCTPTPALHAHPCSPLQATAARRPTWSSKPSGSTGGPRAPAAPPGRACASPTCCCAAASSAPRSRAAPTSASGGPRVSGRPGGWDWLPAAAVTEPPIFCTATDRLLNLPLPPPSPPSPPPPPPLQASCPRATTGPTAAACRG